MPENMMNSSHKATNDKFRDHYEETFGKKKSKSPVGHRLHLWFSPSQKNQSSKMGIPSELAVTFGQLDTGEIVEYTSANRVFDNTSRYDDMVYLGTGTYHHSASRNRPVAGQPTTKSSILSVTCPACGCVLLLLHEGIRESRTFCCHKCGVKEQRTNTTTDQMNNAPKNSVFVWVHDDLDYPKRLARFIEREDLKIVSPAWLTNGRAMALSYNGIVLDHAAMLSMKQHDYLHMLRQRCRPINTQAEVVE